MTTLTDHTNKGEKGMIQKLSHPKSATGISLHSSSIPASPLLALFQIHIPSEQIQVTTLLQLESQYIR